MDWILDRLSERSTWVGIVGYVGIFGIALSPEQALAVAGAAATIVSTVLVFTKDKKPKW